MPEEIVRVNEANQKSDRLEKQVATPADFTSPEVLYEDLIQEIRKYHPSSDLSDIERAYKIARDAHEGQKRKSGEPYIIHPLCVAIILAELELDKETIIAGLLHDVVEDTVMTSEDVTREFGAEVALLVDGVTKLTQLNYQHDKIEVQAENLRKMFLAMAKDIRVILIKLADRLHNMRTMQYQTPAKQIEKSRETMEIYAPIAHRLGISKIKVELDDLSMQYLMPDVYQDLVEKINLNKAGREAFIDSIIKEVGMHISNAGIEAEINGRVKHFFSIYRKMVNQNKTLDQIYDIFAVRIIVDTVKDCYAALGVIHEMYKPIPGRFKDYIAMPKPNMYQSLHTTLIASNGQPFEIQIRTYEMHRTAEYGIAAHWKYKEGKSGETGNESEEAKLSWLRQILEWQKEMSDNKEFLSSIKNDLNLFSDSVYCFTPSGDVKNLPAGSCPIDFAYSIHSAVGNKMVGAKVDGRIVPLDYVVKTGEIVEVLTSSQTGKGPSRDWLSIAKTSQARNKIRSWFKNERRDENIAEGKAEVDREFKRNFIRLSDENYEKFVANLAERQHLRNVDDFYAAIGYGGISVIRLMPYIKEEYNKNYRSQETVVLPEDDKIKTSRRKSGSDGVTVSGIDNCLIKFSRCCNPLPGDNIIGFITRGHGVSIHKRDCPNVPSDFSKCDEPQRWVAAAWNTDVKTEFKASLIITCLSRIGLMADVSVQLAAMKVNINEISSRETKDGRSQISMTITVSNVDHLKNVIARLKKVDGVLSVER